jgi:outer membrane protein insertion porin family
VHAPAPGQSPAPYTRVELTGDTPVDPGLLRQALHLPVPAESLQAALRRVGEVLYARGWVHAVLTPEPDMPGAPATLRLRVDAGEPLRIADVFVRGAEAFTLERVGDVLGLRAGQVYRPAEVEMRLEALAQEYARHGFLYATAVLERLEMTDAGIVLGIRVAEGEPAHLAEVRAEGNSHSRSDLIERLSGLEAGEPVDVRQVDEAASLLRRSGLFAGVDPPLLYRAGGSTGDVGVLLRVREQERRNTIFGSVGMAQDPTTEAAYVNGAIDLQLRNIYGTGRDLGVAWKRDRLSGSNLALAYRERFLFGWPLGFEGDLRQVVRDSTYTFQTAALGVVLPLGRSLGLEVGTAFDRSVFHVGLSGNALRLRQRIGLVFQSLASETDLRRFGLLEVHAEYARKRNDLVRAGVEDHTRVRQTLWSGRFDVGAPLGARHVVAARGEWFVIDSNEAEVPESELFYFGGARTLRGYREDQFRGDQVAYGGVEYRFGDPRGARLYAFTDAGGLRRKHADGRLDEEFHVGYGLGLRGQVASGIFDLSFGIGEERSLAGMKVHVSLLQRF